MSWQNILFAFSLTLFAGLSTSIGSLFAFFTKTMNEKFLAVSLGFSAGGMIYMSFVEILEGGQESLKTDYDVKKGSLCAVQSILGGMAMIFLINKFILFKRLKGDYNKQ